MLNSTQSQVYALVRRGELKAIKLGGRGAWRVEASVLEDYIAELYQRTKTFVDDNPFVEGSAEQDPAEH